MANIKRCLFRLSYPDDTVQLGFPEEYLDQTRVGHKRRLRLIGANDIRRVRTLRKEGIFAIGYDWAIHTVLHNIRAYFTVLFEFIQGKSFEVFIYEREMNQVADGRRPGINFTLLVRNGHSLAETYPNALNGRAVVTLLTTMGRFEVNVEVRTSVSYLTNGWAIFSERHNLKHGPGIMYHCPISANDRRTFIQGPEVKALLQELGVHAGDTLTFTLLKGTLYNGQPRIDVHVSHC